MGNLVPDGRRSFTRQQIPIQREEGFGFFLNTLGKGRSLLDKSERTGGKKTNFNINMMNHKVSMAGPATNNPVWFYTVHVYSSILSDLDHLEDMKYASCSSMPGVLNCVELNVGRGIKDNKVLKL